jgi:hypothetical protein
MTEKLRLSLEPFGVFETQDEKDHRSVVISSMNEMVKTWIKVSMCVCIGGTIVCPPTHPLTRPPSRHTHTQSRTHPPISLPLLLAQGSLDGASPHRLVVCLVTPPPLLIAPSDWEVQCSAHHPL